MEKGAHPRQLPVTPSQGELLLIPTALLTLSLLDVQRKEIYFKRLLLGIASFDGQHQGRKLNRKTSHQFIAITSQMSGYKA